MQATNTEHLYNDTWSFDISTRKWTELHCTGSIPSPRAGHAAVLVDDAMYIFGGSTGKNYLDYLIALHWQLSSELFSMLNIYRYLVHMRNAAQQWFEFHNPGWSHRGRRRKTQGRTDQCYCKESRCRSGSAVQYRITRLPLARVQQVHFSSSSFIVFVYTLTSARQLRANHIPSRFHSRIHSPFRGAGLTFRTAAISTTVAAAMRQQYAPRIWSLAPFLSY